MVVVVVTAAVVVVVVAVVVATVAYQEQLHDLHVKLSNIPQ